MVKLLSVSDIKILIHQAEESFRHEECQTCECYLGYITQMEIDSDPGGKEFLQDQQPTREEIHSCLGCDPCAPGILYGNYLQKKTRDVE